MKLWSWQKENLPSIGHSVRTALAATVAVVVARLVQMPEAYWAAIATLVVMQSSLGATLTLSIQRVVATALGASVGAVEVNYFGANRTTVARTLNIANSSRLTSVTRISMSASPPTLQASALIFGSATSSLSDPEAALCRSSW